MPNIINIFTLADNAIEHISVLCVLCCILLTHIRDGSSEKEHVFGMCWSRTGSAVVIIVVKSLSYVWLWDPMDCSTWGSSVLHCLLEFAQIHVIESLMLSNHLILCHPVLCLPSVFPAWVSFPVSRLFPSGGQSIGASASASVLPMNIQGWFPLGLTGLIFLLSMSQESSLAPQFESTNSLVLSLLYGPTLTSHTWLLEK